MAEPSGSGAKTGIPVFVMLPLSILNKQHEVNYGKEPADKNKSEGELTRDLKTLQSNGVRGVMVDCWWGRVEAAGPGQYNWDGYKNLFSIVKAANLELHVVMSFHACVENGVETIPLPGWVKRDGEKKDLFYKDAQDNPSTEYLSWAVDKEYVLEDQNGNPVSPLKVYEDFMNGFNTHMVDYFDKRDEKGIITMIEVGLGPSGELRYPAYRFPWKFPGVGEFQCYDEYMMGEWKKEAKSQNLQLPQDVGYNSEPDQTLFFQAQPEQPETSLINGPRYWNDNGKSFLTWYSEKLVAHGKGVLKKAKDVFKSRNVKIAAKVPGIHWWYDDESHAAEATAGLFNGVPNHLSVYKSIADTLEVLSATFILTCAELTTAGEKYANASCNPEALVEQVLGVAKDSKVSRACENALAAYDKDSYDRIINVAFHHNISYFTYMRLDSTLMGQPCLDDFKDFVGGMKGT
ncbi:hypothetical protein CY35_10G005700 [Sphagnum magellanicum]|nr:hypothetical protein CY35_10G005700 [Sphagnum magellanicum]KAH9549171.1 hypothetical protein CY35_10G005700 [Sphagnum magellanicum]